MILILLTVAIVALVMAAMAVGAIFSNRCLRGSCGGPDVLGPDGEPLACETCPLRPPAESDAREREMVGAGRPGHG